MINIVLLLSNFFSVSFPILSLTDKEPFIPGKKEANNKGNAKETIEGMNNAVIKFSVLTFFPIQSMVVVTSPIGDQAPPALAAIMIMEM